MDKVTVKNENGDSMQGAYEGASRTAQEIALWSPESKSANGDLLPDKEMLDSRSKDMVRNSGYIAGAVNIHQDSIVGGQFMLNARPNHRLLSTVNPGFDEDWAIEYQEFVESMFPLWAESPDNWPDASRINTFTGLIRLGVGVSVYAGEIMGTVEWLRDTGRPFGTAIQMIDPDRLITPDGEVFNNRIKRGVETNKFGAPVAYHVRQAHPNDWFDNKAYKTKRIPIRKPWGRMQFIHIFEQKRVDQSRGVSDMVSTLKEMKMTKKYQDVVLQNAVVNATYAATIESELPAEAAYNQLGAGGSSEYAEEYMSQIANYVGNSKNIHIDGVKIPHLFPGTKLNLKNAGSTGGVGEDFEKSLLRHIAASLGLSYEQFSRDYTNTNYSSARASMLETWKSMQSRKHMIADRFASTIYTLWLEELMNSKHGVPLPSGVSPSVFYEGLNKGAFSACSWVGASRGQVDEKKETEAAVMRIEKGLSTYEEECSRIGKDFREVFAQRAREEKVLKELKLDFSSDKKTKDVKGDETEDSTEDSKEKEDASDDDE